MTMNDHRRVVKIIVCLVCVGVSVATQCYTCKGSASNEVDANIRCLTKSNLEDCDHFYEYYDLVENDGVATPSSYDFYDYGSPQNKGLAEPDMAGRDEVTETRKRHRRVRAVDTDSATNTSTDADGADDQYEYYDGIATKTAPGTTTTSLIAQKAPMPRMVKIKEPEHYCYSTTTKTAWESYVVEKGCMRIKYCHDRKATLSEWAKPWNFCCKRSRCNAKLVEDKPQRVFGMGCRRTEDCIQGHNNRPVCSNYFRTCPHISTGIIKMECRQQARPRVIGRPRTASRQPRDQERRCFCARNSYPKGPICMSAADQQCPGPLQLMTLILFYLLL